MNIKAVIAAVPTVYVVGGAATVVVVAATVVAHKRLAKQGLSLRDIRWSKESRIKAADVRCLHQRIAVLKKAEEAQTVISAAEALRHPEHAAPVEVTAAA